MISQFLICIWGSLSFLFSYLYLSSSLTLFKEEEKEQQREEKHILYLFFPPFYLYICLSLLFFYYYAYSTTSILNFSVLSYHFYYLWIIGRFEKKKKNLSTISIYQNCQVNKLISSSLTWIPSLNLKSWSI